MGQSGKSTIGKVGASNNLRDSFNESFSLARSLSQLVGTEIYFQFVFFFTSVRELILLRDYGFTYILQPRICLAA